MLKEWTSRLTESAVTVKVLCLYTDMKKRKGGRREGNIEKRPIAGAKG